MYLIDEIMFNFFICCVVFYLLFLCSIQFKKWTAEKATVVPLQTAEETTQPTDFVANEVKVHVGIVLCD